MKKMIFTVMLIAAFAFSLSAQTNEIVLLQNKVASLESSNVKLNNQLRANQRTITDLTNQLKTAQESLAALETDLGATQASLTEITSNFNNKIKQTEQTSSENFASLGKSLTNNTLYWIIAFLAVAVISFLLYRQLRGRLSREKATIYDSIKSNGEQLKTDMSNVIASNIEDFKSFFSADMKRTTDGLSNSILKSSEELRNELRAKLKLATDAFDEQKVKLENQIKALTDKAKKPDTKLHDSEV